MTSNVILNDYVTGIIILLLTQEKLCKGTLPLGTTIIPSQTCRVLSQRTLSFMNCGRATVLFLLIHQRLWKGKLSYELHNLYRATINNSRVFLVTNAISRDYSITNVIFSVTQQQLWQPVHGNVHDMFSRDQDPEQTHLQGRK